MSGLRAVIFDWAGTVVDFGCRAPVAAFQAAFAARGVDVPAAIVRGPMGLHKRDHIRAIGNTEEIQQRFQAAHGRPFDERDVEEIYTRFLPLQAACIREHAELIPGVLELQAELRARRLRIGSTTGYVTELMDVLVPLARAKGYAPEHVVAANEVPQGRPAPWMMFRNMEALGVYPGSAIVKIGDTPADIAEGINAGAWTIGLSRCGNELGLSEAELAALPASEAERRIEAARKRLREAGARFVVDMPLDCIPILDEIDRRLRAGEGPTAK